MNLASKRSAAVVKVLLFALCLVPLAKLTAEAFGIAGWSLGANPIEEILHRQGKWALNLLLASLAITPLRRLTGQHWLIRYRRMLGLFAFFYLVLHFLAYAWLDQGLDLRAIGEDIVERPYITLGVIALLCLIPLAASSTNGMMRRLGSRWKKLHRLVYPAAVLGVWHFYWQVKQDVLEPVIYAAILAVLLAARLPYGRWRRGARPPRPGPSSDPPLDKGQEQTTAVPPGERATSSSVPPIILDR